MTRFPLDTPVQVRPFSSRRDGDAAVIGDERRQVFLSIPAEGLDLLESLAEGVTLGEAVRRYEAEHGESPDTEEFLDALAEEGFVAPADGVLAEPEPEPARRVWNLDWMSQRTAERLLGAPVLAVFGIVFAVAVVMAFDEPEVLPGASSLAFQSHFWAYLWVVIFIATVGVVVHELAHVVAARAAGVSARIKLGNQLYAIVAQTDMSGIWLVPKRRRYLALLAGVIIDFVGAAVLVILLWLDRTGVVSYAEPVRIVLSAVLFTYFIRVLWQTFVFLRTDFYYVIATALDARSLMADTDAYLRNLTRRLRRKPLIDQTGVERGEMRAIRIFAVVWVLGRVVSLATLFAVTLPLLIFYGGRVIGFFAGESTTGAFTWPDVLSFAALTFLLDGGGIAMWVRSLVRNHRKRRVAPNQVLVE